MDLISIIDRCEKPFVSISTGLILIILYSLIRHIFELITFAGVDNFSLLTAVSIVTFFIMTYTGGCFIISYFGEIEPGRTLSLVLRFYFIIILPPLIDCLLGRETGYGYLESKSFLINLLTFTVFNRNSSTGIIFELAIIIIFSSLYVFLKTKSLRKSILTLIFLYLFSIIAGTPSFFIPFHNRIISSICK